MDALLIKACAPLIFANATERLVLTVESLVNNTLDNFDNVTDFVYEALEPFDASY